MVSMATTWSSVEFESMIMYAFHYQEFLIEEGKSIRRAVNGGDVNHCS